MYPMEHDEEITSEQLDALIDDTETLSASRPANATEVRLYVTVDSETLAELEQRAALQGSDLTAVAADALRAGAHSA